MIPAASVTVTITPQTVDQFGDRTPGAPVTAPAVYWQAPGVENVGGQDTLVYDMTVWLPAGTPVNVTDTITIDGDTFEVVSQSIPWRSPWTGWQPGVEVHVRRIQG